MTDAWPPPPAVPPDGSVEATVRSRRTTHGFDVLVQVRALRPLGGTKDRMGRVLGAWAALTAELRAAGLDVEGKLATLPAPRSVRRVHDG